MMDPETAEFLVAWHRLEVASRHIRERFASAASVGMSDFEALVFLSAQDGTPSRTLAAQLGFTSGATTALVDRLETAGYLVRAPHPDDRRSSRLVLTDTGRAAVSGAGAFYADATDQAIPRSELGWTISRFRALARALDPDNM